MTREMGTSPALLGRWSVNVTITQPSTTDQSIVIPGTWEHFKLIQQGFEQSSGVRLFYQWWD